MPGPVYIYKSIYNEYSIRRSLKLTIVNLEIL